MLVQDLELLLVRPPVSVRRATAGSVFMNPARYRGLAFFTHNISSIRCVELLNSVAMNNSASTPIC
jgi:hypothetical protein